MLERAFNCHCFFATIVKNSLAHLKTFSIRGSHKDNDDKPVNNFLLWAIDYYNTISIRITLSVCINIIMAMVITNIAQ